MGRHHHSRHPHPSRPHPQQPPNPSNQNPHNSRSEYPVHPAPGGANYEEFVQEQRQGRPHPKNEVPDRNFTPTEPPQPKGRIFNRLREGLRRKPVTPEDVEKLRLEAEKEHYKYNKKYYKHGQRQLGGQMFGGGGGNVPRQSIRRNANNYQGSSFGMGNSLLDSRPSGSKPIFGGLDSAFGTFSSRPQTKQRGRPKVQPQKPFGSGLNDLFGY